MWWQEEGGSGLWSVVSGHGHVSSLTAERDAERADDPDLAQFLFDEGQLVAEELRGRRLPEGFFLSHHARFLRREAQRLAPSYVGVSPEKGR
jgi:hypothetical protein